MESSVPCNETFLSLGEAWEAAAGRQRRLRLLIPTPALLMHITGLGSKYKDVQYKVKRAFLSPTEEQLCQQDPGKVLQGKGFGKVVWEVEIIRGCLPQTDKMKYKPSSLAGETEKSLI